MQKKTKRVELLVALAAQPGTEEGAVDFSFLLAGSRENEVLFCPLQGLTACFEGGQLSC